MRNISIRTAGEEDVDILLDYVTALRAERLSTIFRFDTAPTRDEEIEFVRQFEQPGSKLYVALDGERAIGNIGIRAGAHPQTRHVGTIGISVLAPYRNQGVGSRLLDAAIDWAGTARLNRLELEVLANNPLARRLYERKGFVFEGCRKGAIAVDDGFVDAIILAMRIDPAA